MGLKNPKKKLEFSIFLFKRR